MSFEFSARRVIVTGGTRGIGRAIALGFARSGAHVSVCGRSPESLTAMAAELGGNHHTGTCDLAQGPQIERYMADAIAALGGVDILVNNASGMPSGDTDEAWESVMNVDLLATVRASRIAAPHLEKNGGAAIINITSISAFRPSARTPAYAAAKAALVHYTMSQAMMLARKGIRVNAIAPGSVEFPGGSWERRRTTEPELYSRVLNSIPFGRLGTPEEIANVALFLASPLAGWVTGQTLSVDGGQLLG